MQADQSSLGPTCESWYSSLESSLKSLVSSPKQRQIFFCTDSRRAIDSSPPNTPYPIQTVNPQNQLFYRRVLLRLINGIRSSGSHFAQALMVMFMSRNFSNNRTTIFLSLNSAEQSSSFKFNRLISCTLCQGDNLV